MRRIVLDKCLTVGVLLYRFNSFIRALLVGTMVGWYVCTRCRQCFDACCFCFKCSVPGILVISFYCFRITLWSRCVADSFLCSTKCVFLVRFREIEMRCAPDDSWCSEGRCSCLWAFCERPMTTAIAKKEMSKDKSKLDNR